MLTFFLLIIALTQQHEGSPLQIHNIVWNSVRFWSVEGTVTACAAHKTTQAWLGRF